MYDVNPLYAIFSETDRLHRDAYPDIFQVIENPSGVKDYYLSCIEDPNAVILIAEKFSSIVGALICTIRTSPDTPVLVPRKYGCIENVTVEKTQRKQGIGKRLIAHAQQWAKERGASAMELTVWEFNQGAMKFYQQLGYHAYRSQMIMDLI